MENRFHNIMTKLFERVVIEKTELNEEIPPNIVVFYTKECIEHQLYLTCNQCNSKDMEICTTHMFRLTQNELKKIEEDAYNGLIEDYYK